MLRYLNLVGEHTLTSPEADELAATLPIELQQQRSETKQEHRRRRHMQTSHALSAPTWGYVTKDACPGLGDDTLHKRLPHTSPPVFVATELPISGGHWKMEGEEEKVDIVFFDFIKPDILSALANLQNERNYTDADVELYLPTTLAANTLMQEYAIRAWN